METIGDIDDNIMKNIKYAFIKNGILLKNIEIDLNELEESKGEENSLLANENEEKNITYIKKSKNISKDYIYLFNGDVYLE